MDKTYPKSCRLRKSWEYQLVGRMGCKYNTPHFVLLVDKNICDTARLGVTVSRKVGNAVQRNRIKRLSREFFRQKIKIISNSNNYLIIVKRGTSALSNSEIFSELNKIFSKTKKYV